MPRTNRSGATTEINYDGWQESIGRNSNAGVRIRSTSSGRYRRSLIGARQRCGSSARFDAIVVELIEAFAGVVGGVGGRVGGAHAERPVARGDGEVRAPLDARPEK